MNNIEVGKSRANEQTPFERQMAKKNNSVVVIKNISDEDFQHSYDGFSYTIRVGESLSFPYPLGMHLAKHLAIKLSREKHIANTRKNEQVKQSANLYTVNALQPFIKEIVIDKKEKPLPPVQSQGEIMNQKTKELQEGFKSEVSKDDKVVNVTKADIIKDLKSRNIKFNPRDSKESLLEMLTEAEMAGNTGE